MDYAERKEKRKYTKVSNILSQIIVNTYLYTHLTTSEIIKEFGIDRRTLYSHIRRNGFEPCRNPRSGNRYNHDHNKRKEGKA